MWGASAPVLIGDGLTAVVLGQAAPDAMGLMGGERVERAGHLDGTPGTDRLGRGLPSTAGGRRLAIGRKEQRAPEVPARGVTPPGPRPGPAIPGSLQARWRDVAGVWWSAPPAGRTSGCSGHANLPGILRQPFVGLARGQYRQQCIDSCIDSCQALPPRRGGSESKRDRRRAPRRRSELVIADGC